MSKKRVESAIFFSKPNSLKELQSFLGLVNYFKDHLRDHSAIAKPLYDMVTVTTRNKIELLTWTNEGHLAFEGLKALVNVCPKLYFIDYTLRIILYTDASDYAHGAYLCQLRRLPNEGVVEKPISFQIRFFHSETYGTDSD
jgi:hypothetical protein